MQTVVIIGAGSFGAWTAHQLAGSGCHVTLIDAFGPGNSRASSGGETRVIRMGYGAEEIYTRWSWRSLELWKDLFERTDPTLFRQTGVLWMARDRDPLTTSTLATLARVAIPHERLSRADLESRWPQVDFGLVTWGIHEPASGVLLARRAVAAVVRDAERRGVRYVTAAVRPPAGHGRTRRRHHRGGRDDRRRHVRVRLRSVAPEALSGSARRPHRVDAAGSAVLRPAAGRPPVRPAGAAGVGRFRRRNRTAFRTSRRGASRSPSIATARSSTPTPASGSAGETLPEFARTWLAAFRACRTRRSSGRRCASTRTRPTATS